MLAYVLAVVWRYVQSDEDDARMPFAKISWVCAIATVMSVISHDALVAAVTGACAGWTLSFALIEIAARADREPHEERGS